MRDSSTFMRQNTCISAKYLASWVNGGTKLKNYTTTTRFQNLKKIVEI